MALLLSTIAVDGARGQWRIVAPNLLPHYPGFGPTPYGAIHFKNGIIWAGSGISGLVFSDDTGKTWKQSSLPNGGVVDISFYDRDTGIVSTPGNGWGQVYRTTDRGQTWKVILSPDGICYRIAHNRSPLVIHTLSYDGNTGFCTSLDGGETWSTGEFVHQSWITFSVAEDGTIFLPVLGQTLVSRDLGGTWTAAGNIDIANSDSYSIEADLCGSQRIYDVHEDLASSYVNGSQILTSSDSGLTWTSVFSHPIPYLAGSIAIAQHTAYVPLVADLQASGPLGAGVLRTTDQGSTWTNIALSQSTGGPCNYFDSRNICAINDNIIFLVDTGGSIWATLNSGGDSIPFSSSSFSSLTASPSTLFSSDTISCDSVAHSVLFSRTGCTPPSVSSLSVIGPDSASYRAHNLNSDSISVTLSALKQGNQQALLIFFLDNGSSDTVILAGYVRQIPFNYSISPQQIFAHDSVYPCDGPSAETVYLNTSGCKIPDISSSLISGNAASDYKLAKSLNSFTGFDSIKLSFTPSDTGIRNASYIMSLSNGSNITIPLSGYGIPTIPLLLASSDQTTDTLGATVSVPITINNLQRPEDIDLVLHYDGTVDYLGSFSPSGTKLDVAGEQWKGRSELHIVGAAPGVIAGYAKFNVFNDSGEDAHAQFDSVSVLTAKSPCEYSMPKAVTSTITAPSGCGATILSQFVHLGIVPTFSVRPNPASGDVWITASVDLGDVTFAIYDMLGTGRSEVVASVQKDNPVELTLPHAEGIYNIVAKYSGGMSMMRIVREHY
jgi:photosystem II stability/assembly factor-like uncharacterized protein